jgi:hypothetical protein
VSLSVAAHAKKPWRSKYRAQPVIDEDGKRFASKKEFKRYCQLRLLESAGTISRLELQPRFDLVINGKNCGFYKGDFAYFEKNKRVIEDVKGVKTPVYSLKKRIVEALYSIVIVEV